MADLRYPFGKFVPPKSISPEERGRLLDQIEEAPARLRAAVKGLSEQQLDTPYRPEGWTVRQVLHHVPDSHMNAFIRFKLAMTEDEPIIKPYMEAKWALLGDVPNTPVETSVTLLELLHEKWIILLKSLTPADFARKFKHPELGPQTLDRALAMYAWHGQHHVAHITRLRDRMGWK